MGDGTFLWDVSTVVCLWPSLADDTCSDGSGKFTGFARSCGSSTGGRRGEGKPWSSRCSLARVGGMQQLLAAPWASQPSPTDYHQGGPIHVLVTGVRDAVRQMASLSQHP